MHIFQLHEIKLHYAVCVSVRAAIMFLSTYEWEQLSGEVYITLCC